VAHVLHHEQKREMVMASRRDKDFARDLIRLSLSESGLKEFGNYPLFLAVQHAFARSQDFSDGRQEILALAQDALWRAASEWLAGRSFPTGSARNTLARARREGFDLVQRARESLLPRSFLR
jgi:hypothetical protein